ncbi:hypothetical protein ACJRO7_004240 [Eucalyptus globulus]|uniref:Zinc finger PMZ-type domain-containing protein n=1 Tax=Eucalyptus globulus TaxID=34317 RepID=A0ABD3IWP5_EUCGL
MEAKCASACGWRLYGIWVQAEKTFLIKRVGSLHSCNISLTNRQATSTWLAREYMPKIRARLTYSVTEMQTDARERSYLEELERVSKNGTFMMEVNPATKVFERFYVGFDECVIGLDGCFHKTGLKGMLLCAIEQDGNNQMFLIAWAVFLTQLFIDLNVGTGEGWAFISDKQKLQGLMNAVSWLSPQAEHRNCARHIYNLFWRAMRCTFEADFDLVMANSKMECPKGYEDFMRQDSKHFCRAFIKTGTKCDVVENNLTMLMERMTERSQLMVDRMDPIFPRIRMNLEKTKLESKYCFARASFLGNKFEVEGDGNRFMVDLTRKTCARREWGISGIPCRHAICCIAFMKLDINDYVDDCFKKDAYENCYKFPFPIMNGEKMLPKAKRERLKKVDKASGAQASSQANRSSNGDSIIIRKERTQASALSSIILLSYHMYIVINVLCSFCFFRLNKDMDFSYSKLLGIPI